MSKSRGGPAADVPQTRASSAGCSHTDHSATVRIGCCCALDRHDCRHCALRIAASVLQRQTSVPVVRVKAGDRLKIVKMTPIKPGAATGGRTGRPDLFGPANDHDHYAQPLPSSSAALFTSVAASSLNRKNINVLLMAIEFDAARSELEFRRLRTLEKTARSRFVFFILTVAAVMNPRLALRSPSLFRQLEVHQYR